MKNRIILTGVLSALAFTGVANAQFTGSGTLGVTADVSGSLNLVFKTDASGLVVTGTGTSVASLPLGSVSMYGGTVPTNVTKTLTGTTAFALSTPFDIRVDLANSESATFSLAAELTAVDSTNTWAVAGIAINGATSTAITATGAYATDTSYAFKLTVPASESTNLSISNGITFVATAN